MQICITANGKLNDAMLLEYNHHMCREAYAVIHTSSASSVHALERTREK
jgi:hypothetical protein